jgi:(p)ppGpp synthase/HD superfamily hydrolase
MSTRTPRFDASGRFLEALEYAAQLHARQTRKGTDTPYVAHLLGVCALVIEHGGGEDEAIAALLHDAPEDQGGHATLAAIRDRFGPRVAAIVEACSDTLETPKPPWRARKERYLAHLAHADDAVRLVSAADKLYNARSVLDDLKQSGEAVFERFTGRKEGTLWYYRALSERFTRLGPRALAAELERVVSELERLSH